MPDAPGLFAELSCEEQVDYSSDQLVNALQAPTILRDFNSWYHDKRVATLGVGLLSGMAAGTGGAAGLLSAVVGAVAWLSDAIVEIRQWERQLNADRSYQEWQAKTQLDAGGYVRRVDQIESGRVLSKALCQGPRP